MIPADEGWEIHGMFIVVYDSLEPIRTLLRDSGE